MASLQTYTGEHHITTFSVPDMSCGHCKSAIEKAIGQADISADYICLGSPKNCCHQQAVGRGPDRYFGK
ncbi:heavy-metal-associated domain-containing protein [Parasedimentitalea maritima]|uniref:HMA domain-containing protein n=1 Tax=Parasedimentitalea maritima TaxID=2578117 RepID=A0A6A4RDB5_9RHOB|nr:hypothetical protein GP644_21750 [Zongyanglinia marina]